LMIFQQQRYDVGWHSGIIPLLVFATLVA
jgi:hypothetical protein